MAKKAVYFVAAGRSLEGVQRFWEDYRKASEAHSAFAREFGCEAWTDERFDNGDRPTGLVFNDPPDPKLWRRYVKARNPKVFCPNKTTPEGKALAKRMAELPPSPGPWQLHLYVMPESDHGNNRVWDLESRSVYSRCDLENVGSQWIIKVNHNDGDPPIVAPLDAKRIQESQYLELKERADNESQ